MQRGRKVTCYTSRKMALKAANRSGKMMVVPFERIVERKTKSTGRTHVVRQPYFCLTKKPRNWGKVT